MTPREKILREALSQAKYQFNEIDLKEGSSGSISLAWKGAEDAEKAMQKADLMEDFPNEGEPSEEDKKRLNEIFIFLERNWWSLDYDECVFMASILKKYMKIE